MKRLRCIAIGILVCFLLWYQPTRSQAQQGRDPDIEQEIHTRLKAISPQAVPVFEQATNSMDLDDYEAAKQGFERVLLLATDFPDALRRLSQVELRLNRLEDALAHAQRAYVEDPTSPYNKITLAEALLVTNTTASNLQAYTLAKEAIQRIPDDWYANYILLMTASAQDDLEVSRRASEDMLRLDPENPVSYFFHALILAADGQAEKAETELLKARSLGMPAELVDQAMRDTGLARQARIYRTVRWSGYLVGIWISGMLLLVVTGLVLNKLTLRAVRQSENRLQTTPSKSEILVRKIYRIVIGVTSVYFYISIPFIILLVIAIGAGIIYFFFAVGAIPTQLVLIIGVSVLYTLFAILRSVFTRYKQGNPGRTLTRDEAPELWCLTDAVADKLQTQPIEAIYLTPGSEVAVFEQGGAMQKARGQGKRSLLIGLGVLPGMTVGEFRSILAHEYGHFARKDTAGGDIAIQAERSMYTMALGLARTGQARWYNPAWLFLNIYHRVFKRITLGASRLQEILADRYAAISFGSQNFISGLKHVIRQSVTFSYAFNEVVTQAVENKTQLSNLYSSAVSPGEEMTKKIDAAIDEALNRTSGAYDSHPSPNVRIRLVESLGLPVEGYDPNDDSPAWDLLPNAAGLQNEMTAKIQADINQQMGWDEAPGS